MYNTGIFTTNVPRRPLGKKKTKYLNKTKKIPQIVPNPLGSLVFDNP